MISLRAAGIASFLGATSLCALCRNTKPEAGGKTPETRMTASQSDGSVADTGASDSARGRVLHVVEVNAEAPGNWLAFFMSGDGGWVAADRRLADALAAHGVSVIGLDARGYLSHKRTPEETSRDVSRTVEAYRERWGKERLLLIGSSRGADLMPLIANRMPDDLRRRVKLIVLFGAGRWASFEFHWSDLVMDTHRATDLPVLPELERLRGTPTLCIYGSDDHNSLCSSTDTTLVMPYARDGGHRLRGDQSADLASVILAALPK